MLSFNKRFGACLTLFILKVMRFRVQTIDTYLIISYICIDKSNVIQL